MEYRRHRTVERKSDNIGGRILIMLIIIAGGIYLLSLTKTGSWIEKNVFAPIAQVFAADKAPGGSDSLFTSNTGGDISLPRFECYLIQMGAFSTLDNANELAKELKQQGGGGYVLQDNERFRVFAAGYATEEEARTVKAGLKARGYDCSIHKLMTDAEQYSVSVVSGTDSTISQLQTVLYALLETHDNLLELAKGFDEGNMTVEQGMAAAKSIYDRLTSQTEGISALPDEITGCIKSYEASLEQLIGTQTTSATEFGGMVKNAQIKAACEFVEVINTLM